MGNEKRSITANMVVLRDEEFVVRQLASFGMDIGRSCDDPICCMEPKRPYRVKSVSADGLWASLLGHNMQVPTEGLRETEATMESTAEKKSWWSSRK